MVGVSDGAEFGSSQGANRAKSIVNATGFDPTSSQAEAASKVTARELGGNRNPSDLGLVGAKSINTGNSTDIVVPPEIGKGSITDSIV